MNRFDDKSTFLSNCRHDAAEQSKIAVQTEESKRNTSCLFEIKIVMLWFYTANM